MQPTAEPVMVARVQPVKNAKCCHILAVKLALRMTVDDNDSYGQDSDITKPRQFILKEGKRNQQKTTETWRCR